MPWLARLPRPGPCLDFGFQLSIWSYKKPPVKKLGVEYWALPGTNSLWRPCYSIVVIWNPDRSTWRRHLLSWKISYVISIYGKDKQIANYFLRNLKVFQWTIVILLWLVYKLQNSDEISKSFVLLSKHQINREISSYFGGLLRIYELNLKLNFTCLWLVYLLDGEHNLYYQFISVWLFKLMIYSIFLYYYSFTQEGSSGTY